MVQLLRERLARPASTDGASTEAAYISQSYDTNNLPSSPASEQGTRAPQGQKEEESKKTRRSASLGGEIDSFQENSPLVDDDPAERDLRDGSTSGCEALFLNTVSPPSKRQQLPCVAVQSRRDSSALNGALICRGAVVQDVSYFYEASRFCAEVSAFWLVGILIWDEKAAGHQSS